MNWYNRPAGHESGAASWRRFFAALDLLTVPRAWDVVVADETVVLTVGAARFAKNRRQCIAREWWESVITRCGLLVLYEVPLLYWAANKRLELEAAPLQPAIKTIQAPTRASPPNHQNDQIRK
jgi:hypothetical protein